MQDQKNSFYIPAAIILAGFVIAGGIYLSNKDKTPSVINNEPAKTSNISVNPVNEKDHILGDPNAPITIVEFSDTECPFCKRFQTTMNTIKSTYIKDGKVSWVYRHFPLDSLHQKSRKEAEATECANELGGNGIFWKMLDTIYTNTPANDGLDLAKLPEFAKTIGLDVTKFNECLASGKYAAAVEADLQDGIKAGAEGTPYSVLLLKTKLSTTSEQELQKYIVSNGLVQNVIISLSKKEVILSGALPVEMVQTILDTLLK